MAPRVTISAVLAAGTEAAVVAKPAFPLLRGPLSERAVGWWKPAGAPEKSSAAAPASPFAAVVVVAASFAFVAS